MSHNFSEVFKQLVSHGKATLVMKTDPVEQPVTNGYFLFFIAMGYLSLECYYTSSQGISVPKQILKRV